MTVKELLQQLIDFPNEYEIKIARPNLREEASRYHYHDLVELDEEARQEGNVCLLITE